MQKISLVLTPAKILGRSNVAPNGPNRADLLQIEEKGFLIRDDLDKYSLKRE
jgi:hypothetical protein